MNTTPQIDDYILQHIDAESEYLQKLYRDTHVKLLYPRMASGHLQGRLLKMLVGMVRPQTILEIGTYSGYSTLCMAEGLGDGGVIHTFEINDELEEFTRPWIERSAFAKNIVIHIGDALQLIPPMNMMFDMAFVDGDKRHYADYYTMIMPKLKTGGYIVADNTLWDGHVTERDTHDAQTLGIRLFNDMVASDEDVEKVILPLRDGLTIIRKMK